MQEFIVMTASAKTRPSWKWTHPRQRVAVVRRTAEYAEQDRVPKMISVRARGVREITIIHDCAYVGSTERCQYHRALAEAYDLAQELNSGLEK
jgi:hypothetical protein